MYNKKLTELKKKNDETTNQEMKRHSNAIFRNICNGPLIIQLKDWKQSEVTQFLTNN